MSNVESSLRPPASRCSDTRASVNHRSSNAAATLTFYIALAAPMAVSADDFWDTLSSGKVDLTARYRAEDVHDDQQPTVHQATANTLRTALGYGTSLYEGFGAYVQIEDVRAIGAEHYNDGGRNGVTRRATVVDPEGTELQQAVLRYRGVPRTQLSLGRQEIDHRAAPLNRYVGTVAWRQNWQSYDAMRVVNDAIAAVKIDYAYVWNVNRIFGEDNHLPDRSDFNLDGNLLSISYSGIPYTTVETYWYRLNFNSRVIGTRALSTSTYGARLQGAYDVVSQAAKVLYVVEGARQQDFGNNPLNLQVNYYMVELGATKLFNSQDFESVTFKLSYELLQGDGRVVVRGAGVPASFQTPLGTNHAFQGWADRFLTTPADGIKDSYGTLGAKALGTTFTAVFHHFESDHDSYMYGREWNLQATRVFGDHYTVGVKYANYNADINRLNRARNGRVSAGKQAFDQEKLWLWAELKF